MTELLIGLLSGIGVAIIEGIGVIIIWNKNRKAALADKNDAITAEINALSDKVQNIDTSLLEIMTILPLQSDGIRESLHDRISYLCGVYIAKDKVEQTQLENLERMFKAYEGLHGNGHLHNQMDRVRALKQV